MAAAAAGPRYFGWRYEPSTGDLDVVADGTVIATFDGADGDVEIPAGTVSVQDGGAVTQGTDRSTGVTLSTHAGVITMDDDSLAAGAEATFTVTNTLVAANDVVIVNLSSGLTTGAPMVYVSDVAAGSFNITITNLHATTADTTADTINFVVIKGANS